MKYLLTLAAALLLGSLAHAGCHVAAVRVQKVVAVKQVQVVEKVRVAQVVTPVVQVHEVRAAVVAPVYAAPLGYGSDRLDRLERAVERLTEANANLIQRLTK